MKIRYLKTVCGADGSFYYGNVRTVGDLIGAELCAAGAAVPVIEKVVERAMQQPEEVREEAGTAEEPEVPMPSPSGGGRRRR